jgi:hypothetical protein
MSTYRNGTYVAFNGMGTTNPTESDMKYYGLLQHWNSSKKIDFTFSDSHDKTYSVQDSSQIATLKSRLLERLKNSKHLLLIATELASINRGLLNWEIEKAVEEYGIPIIVAYPGFDKITSITSLRNRLPSKLIEYIDNGKVKTIHVPFKQAILEKTIQDFSVHTPPKYTVTTYTEDFYKNQTNK